MENWIDTPEVVKTKDNVKIFIILLVFVILFLILASIFYLKITIPALVEPRVIILVFIIAVGTIGPIMFALFKIKQSKKFPILAFEGNKFIFYSAEMKKIKEIMISQIRLCSIDKNRNVAFAMDEKQALEVKAIYSDLKSIAKKTTAAVMISKATGASSMARYEYLIMKTPELLEKAAPSTRVVKVDKLKATLEQLNAKREEFKYNARIVNPEKAYFYEFPNKEKPTNSRINPNQ